MAYNEKLDDRVREALSCLSSVEEKKMFRGVTFMVNGKMCISVSGQNLMCRFDPAIHGAIMDRRGVKPVIMKTRAYNGYVYVTPEGFRSKKDFDYWIELCLSFNVNAKAANKKSKQDGHGF